MYNLGREIYMNIQEMRSSGINVFSTLIVLLCSCKLETVEKSAIVMIFLYIWLILKEQKEAS